MHPGYLADLGWRWVWLEVTVTKNRLFFNNKKKTCWSPHSRVTQRRLYSTIPCHRKRKAVLEHRPLTAVRPTETRIVVWLLTTDRNILFGFVSAWPWCKFVYHVASSPFIMPRTTYVTVTRQGVRCTAFYKNLQQDPQCVWNWEKGNPSLFSRTNFKGQMSAYSCIQTLVFFMPSRSWECLMKSRNMLSLYIVSDQRSL